MNRVELIGTPIYDNEGNGHYRQWAVLEESFDKSYSLLDMFTLLLPLGMDPITDWNRCKVKVTLEILEVKEKESEEHIEIPKLNIIKVKESVSPYE